MDVVELQIDDVLHATRGRAELTGAPRLRGHCRQHDREHEKPSQKQPAETNSTQELSLAHGTEWAQARLTGGTGDADQY